MLVGRRALPALLAVIAAVADARGAHGLAFDALLAAVPFTAVTALICFGEYLEHRAGSLGGLQSLGASALAACLVVFGIKLLLAAAPHLRRLSLHPAKP